MNHSSMRFKNFVWPINPTEISFSTENNIKELNLLYGGCVLQNLGRQPKVIKGLGSFVGRTAFDDFERLQALFEEKTSGVLLISGMTPCLAMFAKLQMLGQPSDNTVSYGFTFIEDISTQTDSDECRYTQVANGQNLWHISSLCNVPIETLMELNPDIPSPWDVTAGERVRIK